MATPRCMAAGCSPGRDHGALATRDRPSGEALPLPLTVQDVDADACCVGIGRVARVQPRICRNGFLDEESAGRDETLLRHQADASPRRVEVNYLEITVSELRYSSYSFI